MAFIKTGAATVVWALLVFGVCTTAVSVGRKGSGSGPGPGLTPPVRRAILVVDPAPPLPKAVSAILAGVLLGVVSLAALAAQVLPMAALVVNNKAS
ncbi:hypothetical protein BSKO_02457 [Bryopsis sp. KO-2023]|nr:hypothetical protein BSKO_02457 [Bryopsis sp. KO-2023]